MKRWWWVCFFLPPHHQHLSSTALLTLSFGYGPVAAWPDRSWQYRLAMDFGALRRSPRLSPLPGGGGTFVGGFQSDLPSTWQPSGTGPRHSCCVGQASFPPTGPRPRCQAPHLRLRPSRTRRPSRFQGPRDGLGPSGWKPRCVLPGLWCRPRWQQLKSVGSGRFCPT